MPDLPPAPIDDDDDQAEADRAAGWDSRFGHAPGDHTLPVEGLETSDTPPVVA